MVINKTKLVALSALVVGVFAFANPVVFAAEEEGPVIVQGIVQEGHKHEMTVNLVRASDEKLIEVYKLNEENNWIQKDEVPVGKYKIYTYSETIQPRAEIQVKGTLMEKEIIKDPKKSESADETPRFIVMQGDKKFISDFYGMVDFQRFDGSAVKGIVSQGEMERYYKEAIYKQTGLTETGEYDDPSLRNDVAGPEHAHDHDHDHSDINELESQYTPEVLEEKAKKANFDDVKKDGVPYGLIAGFVAGIVALAGGGYLWYRKKK